MKPTWERGMMKVKPDSPSRGMYDILWGRRLSTLEILVSAFCLKALLEPTYVDLVKDNAFRTALFFLHISACFFTIGEYHMFAHQYNSLMGNRLFPSKLRVRLEGFLTFLIFENFYISYIRKTINISHNRCQMHSKYVCYSKIVQDKMKSK